MEFSRPENNDFCILHSCCCGSFFQQSLYLDDRSDDIHCSLKHTFNDLISKGWMIHFIFIHSKSSCNSCVADCSRKWLLLHDNYWHQWSRESVSEVVLHFNDLNMKLVIIRSNVISWYFLDCIYDGDNLELFLLNSKCLEILLFE